MSVISPTLKCLSNVLAAVIIIITRLSVMWTRMVSTTTTVHTLLSALRVAVSPPMLRCQCDSPTRLMAERCTWIHSDQISDQHFLFDVQ